jgi:hypothetical protein
MDFKSEIVVVLDCSEAEDSPLLPDQQACDGMVEKCAEIRGDHYETNVEVRRKWQVILDLVIVREQLRDRFAFCLFSGF